MKKLVKKTFSKSISLVVALAMVILQGAVIHLQAGIRRISGFEVTEPG